MSLQAMTAVFNLASDVEGSTYLVLLVLADHADLDHVCYPSLDRIARRAHVSRSTAIRAVQECQVKGYLLRQIGGGGRRTNVYRVMPSAVDNPDAQHPLWCQPDTPRAAAGVSSASREVSSAPPRGVTGDTQNPGTHEPIARARTREPVDEPPPMPDPDELRARLDVVRAGMRPPQLAPGALAETITWPTTESAPLEDDASDDEASS